MARAASRAASTVLRIGSVEAQIELFSTADKPGKLAQFATAGPNGGVLKAVAMARPVPSDEPVEQPAVPVIADPLADDPFAAGAYRRGPESEDPGPERDELDEQIDAASERVEKVRELVSDAPPTHMFGGVKAPERVDGEYGRQLVEDGTGEVVPPENVRRGVRLEDGAFVDCTEQLAEIEERTKLERATVEGFVPVSHVERARVKGAYYVGPQNPESAKALRLIFEALRAERRLAVVKVTKRSRQSLMVLGWLGDALMLYELVWSEDFRPPPKRAIAIQTAEVAYSEVAMARELVKAMAAPASILEDLRDDALALREKLYARAVAGEDVGTVVPAQVEAEPESALLAELEASIAASKHYQAPAPA